MFLLKAATHLQLCSSEAVRIETILIVEFDNLSQITFFLIHLFLTEKKNPRFRCLLDRCANPVCHVA